MRSGAIKRIFFLENKIKNQIVLKFYSVLRRSTTINFHKDVSFIVDAVVVVITVVLGLFII
jgi:hypothetical protein